MPYFLKIQKFRNFDIGNWYYFVKFNSKQLFLITFFREMNFDLVNLHFYFLKMHVRSKKSKCENYVKLGPKISKMMIGFQIWPCNANLITFDPLFGRKNCRKLAKSGIWPIFESLFLKIKKIKILILATDFILWNSILSNFSL